MGLDYLNKKVWHPGSMKNIQKVWQAQQARLQVVKKDKERKKKLQDQKHNQEMKRIQVQAGLIPRSHLQRMDWMYDWGNKVQQQKNSQEYFTGEKKAKKEVKHIFQEQATNTKCQDFILLHQDPMYEIIKEQMKQKELLMNNPIQMKNIIRQVEDDYLLMHPEQKKKKKHKKDKKKKKRRNISRSSSSSRESYGRSRKRSYSSSDRNSEKQRSREKPSKQSQLYKDYLKKKFGSILHKDQNGNLKPDYNMHRRKYKTQYQIQEYQAQRRRNELMRNAKRLKEMRKSESDVSQNEEKGNYNEGLAKIRKEMFDKRMQNEKRDGRY